MRKRKKRQATDFLNLLEQAHIQINRDIDSKRLDGAMELLAQCQEGAMELGNMIEGEEGEGCVVIPLLQSYCETVYEIYEQLRQDQHTSGKNAYKHLRKSLLKIENSVKNDIKVRLEIAFFPYKASMWDSMESVWIAADADPGCDPYVVPIPYYERRADRSFGKRYYEGEDFPGYLPVVHYEEYDVAERKPDIIYIHNPYDEYNYVTSVDPRYYSGKLKKYTDCLVYLPYYATTGGMSEGQSICMSYFNVDYIVVQSKKLIGFFDPRIPREKFLPLGSPKFDRIIKLCKNPPKPPGEWIEKIGGRKVYFYNTSLGGMLGDTENFLKKMEYVFQCFKDRKGSCLLWRPHPLMDTTFDSMRSSFYGKYKELRAYFIDHDLGIYDDTPDITETIALCDAYVGDSGTSITSLFGITGKPMFILDNAISSEPGVDDWKGQIIRGFHFSGENQWLIIQGNKLYYSANDDYQYEYCCDLTKYSQGGYYLRVIEVGKNAYVCPGNAQDILVIREKKIIKKIRLEQRLEKWGAFAEAYRIEKYLFLIPNQYPALVRYDTVQDTVDYITGYENVFIGYAQGQRRIGGCCVWKNQLMLASPVDGRVAAVDANTKEIQVLDTGAKDCGGYMGMITDGKDLWMSPVSGTTLTRWNPESGELHEYALVPEGFVCKSYPYGHECLDYPYNVVAFDKNLVFISPYWGNMFLCLDKDTGEMREWKPPFETSREGKDGYYISESPGYFVYRPDSLERGIYLFYSQTDSRLYEVNLRDDWYQEIKVSFSLDELKAQEPGFREISEWLPYGCQENCFNTLRRFLDGDIMGDAFDRARQLRAYKEITANCDGTSGEKIHRFLTAKRS